VFDTSVALLAGLIIFPALYSVGAEPSSGPGLVFVAMPAVFDQLPAGTVFGVTFYALLAVAALTSTISLLEVVVAYLVGERGWNREKAVWGVTGACFLFAIPSALSQGAMELSLFGQSFLDLMNILFGNIALSLGALLIAVFAGWRWGVKKALAEMPDLPLPGLWAVAIKYVCPAAVAGIMIYILVTGKFF
jgi:NSS family neurotransmitter:Na+ symporter